MLLSNGNALVELTVLTQLAAQDISAFIASHRAVQDVRIAQTALQIAHLRITAGDMPGAYRYASAARIISATLGDACVVEQAERVCSQVDFAVDDAEGLARCSPY